MFIREINITGFRSYDQLTTISDLSPKHNVVVGRNGSGKSNFFFAIQFVLSNEFNTLNQDARNNLLHEGTGSRATNAKVEIVFDNSLRRLPSDSNEVRVSRQINAKKDQYLIDNKNATRTDIMNLLESAGISRSNPYFIVKQGKVMELATATDAFRLKLIREVAGTRVFDERKEESMKLLEETQGRLSKCEQLLGFMEERLKKLEEEKEDLKEYQTHDRMKRAIEYAINSLESNEARRRCDKLSAQREQLNTRQNQAETEMMLVQESIQSVETRIRQLDSRYKVYRDETDRLMNEKTELLEKKKSVELLIKDLQDDIGLERGNREGAEEMLERLNQEISQKSEELDQLIPNFNNLVEQEKRIQTDISINEQKCKELNAKLGRQDQFGTVQERDSYLNREINTTNKQIRETDAQIKEIERSIEEDSKEIEQLQQEIHQHELELNKISHDIDNKNQNLKSLKIRAERENIRLKDSLVSEEKVRNELTSIKGDISNAEEVLMSLAPKTTVNGIRSVELVLEWMRENNADNRYDDVLNGYIGCVHNLMKTDPQYHLAVEVTAENRLFYHVVANDQVAMKILEQINSRELRGEVNFFPLNRITNRPRRDVSDPDATSMLSLIQYNEQYDGVMRQLFAETVVVPNLDVGSRVSRNERFNCVTIDGDQVNRRGPLTGGYMDRKRSKLEASNFLRQAKEKLAPVEAALTAKQAESAAARHEYEKLMLEINHLEADITNLNALYRSSNERKHMLAERVNRYSANSSPKQQQIVELKQRKRRMEARIEILNSQLGTPLESSLSTQERAMIEDLQNQTQQFKATLEDVSRRRVELEQTKNRLENLLRVNLVRRRDKLDAQIKDRGIEDKRYSLESEQEQLKQLNERLKKVIDQSGELERYVAEYNQEREEFNRENETHQNKRSELEAEIDNIAKQTDAFCTKMAELQLKKEEFTRKMNEIGIVPADTLRTYQNMNLKQLDKKLTECLNQLKKYENVNKKALDQFVRAKSQKEGLSKNVDELKLNEQARLKALNFLKSIKTLIEVLDNRRHETLQLTFKQVAKNFNEVFRRLIPDGRADLIMHVMDGAENSQESSQSSSIQDSMQRFIGIGVKVSFTGTGETREMNHLSGGQKSLVALALIFAIQKCDPAPFYLFDEVDAALDRQHRESVASMIHELSENAQFITTTFRPELLEHAEKYYGVRFRNKVSYIDPIDRETAADFVTDDQTHS